MLLAPALDAAVERYAICETSGFSGFIMVALRNILVPIDFNEASQHAVAYAKDLASATGAQLHLLHVLEDVFALPAA